MRDIKSAALKAILHKSGLPRTVLAMHEHIGPWFNQRQEGVKIIYPILPFFYLQVLQLSELLLILVLNYLVPDVDHTSGHFLILSLHFEAHGK